MRAVFIYHTDCYTNSMQPQALTEDQLVAIEHTNKLKLIWGLIALIGPTALIIISIVVYAVVNVTIASTGGSSGISTVANIILFLVGAVATLTLFPGIIVGIVLLATRKKVS